ncbi:MAG: ferritin [Candidatus Omnitrophica bacterium]|nr:ferritin [Candidatus Omnitrophota bacterium]
MGTRGREIVDVDIEQLIKKLNKALADEWLAYYQYWMGAKVAKGPMRTEVTEELVEHAQEELKHADMIAERIIQLGGTPLLTPEEWYKETNCGYDAPADPKVAALLEQNIKGEQCAIDVYKELMEFVKGKDIVTYHMVLQILGDEIEHEEDLEALAEDLSMIGK